MDIQPFTIDIPDGTLTDLKRRLENTRWPPDLDDVTWSFGVEGSYLRELVRYWIEEYDWRKHERAINGFANYKTHIDEVPVHFIREPGRGPNPIPIILTHGWPWTFWFYEKMIRPLSDPASYGGDPSDCFDVIVPSLPGYGFSTPLHTPGIAFMQVADIWRKLMCDSLGYPKFAAMGGDWGAFVTSQLGHKHADALHGIYLSLTPPLDRFHSTALYEDYYAPDEAWALERTRKTRPLVASHFTVQTHEPQTVSYAMHDSPVGLCAWLLKRYRDWSDCDGNVERRFSKDDILTAVMVYWVTSSFSSSARLYAETARQPWTPSQEGFPVVRAPTAIGVFPKDVRVPARRWAEEYYNLQSWKLMTAGGHFGPFEEPAQLVTDMRTFYRRFR